MKKIFFTFVASVFAVSACSILYPPAFNSVDWTPTSDPFAEIGKVLTFKSTNDPDVSRLMGFLYDFEANELSSYGTDAIVIAFDFSESALKPKDYPDYAPILLYNAIITNDYYMYDIYMSNCSQSGYLLQSGNFKLNDPRYDNRLKAWDFNPNIWYIVVKGVQGSPCDLFSTGSHFSSFKFDFKMGNYLATPGGSNAINAVSAVNGVWSIWGYQDLPGGGDFVLQLTNDGELLKINQLAVGDNTNKNISGTYLLPSGRGCGFKVNSCLADWGLQGAGSENTLSAGTKIRIIWEDIQTSAPTNAPSNWIAWPSNAVVVGTAPYMSYSNSTWNPETGYGVYIDLDKKKAVVELTVNSSNNSPAFIFKMSHRLGWDYGNEVQSHYILLSEPPVDGAYTIYVNTSF